MRRIEPGVRPQLRPLEPDPSPELLIALVLLAAIAAMLLAVLL
jgi:hypothetical protein